MAIFEYRNLTLEVAEREKQLFLDDGATIEIIPTGHGFYTLRVTYPDETKPADAPVAAAAFLGGTATLAGVSKPAAAKLATAKPINREKRALSASFLKHGTFIYDAGETLSDYGSLQDPDTAAKNVAQAMKRAGMTHCWVRIHGQSAYPPNRQTLIKKLIAAMKAEGIAVAGWGWCQGEDPESEANLAANELSRYGLTDYLADIENKTHNADWTPKEVEAFCQHARQRLTGSFGITTYPLIDWHEPELMKAAVPYVDAFAPQVYWFNFPNQRMINDFKRPNDSLYAANNPAAYAELCLDRWAKLTGDIPLILTGQAYWGESDFSQAAAEAKLTTFLSTFAAFGKIVGLNWWHFGGKDAMSHGMLEVITEAKLGDKQYGKSLVVA